MNIGGVWTYKEDFALGKSEGKVEIVQTNNSVTAFFIFIEEVENDYKILVKEKTCGTIEKGKILLESVEVSAVQDGKEIEYLPNNFEVHIVSETKLVGSTYDSENVCGVFVMEKI